MQITDGVSPALARLFVPGLADALRQPLGAALATLFREHFLALGTNKRGWPTTNFWARAASATSCETQSDGVSIRVAQPGVRQRFLGGEIRAQSGHYLTIPATAAAYGRRPADFPALIFAMVQRPGGPRRALVEPGHSTAEDSGVLFWLVRSVSQQPDPDVLPAQSEIDDTARAVITKKLTR